MWRLRPLLSQAAPLLLVAVLVLQRGATDALTWYTRVQGTTYSGSSVALVSEVLKYPVVLFAVAALESPSRVLPTLRGVFAHTPLAMAWIGAAYAVQNVLYFLCLRHISAVGYQLLSQTEIVFAALLMRFLVKKRLSGPQTLAVCLLLVGASLTQLAELSGASVLGSNIALGSVLTVLSAFLSTLPNAFYERLMKSGDEKSEWVTNLQLITWTTIWVSVIKLFGEGGPPGANSALGLGGLWQAVHGFTPAVWIIALLKSLNCITVPLCLKYADNVMYGYVKPASAILTCIATSVVARRLPEPLMIGGIALVFSSLTLYAKG